MPADATSQLTDFMVGFAHPFLAGKLTRQVRGILQHLYIYICKPDQLFYIYSLCLLN